MTQSHTHKEDEALQVVTDAEVEAATRELQAVGDWLIPPGSVRRALESFAASRPVAVGVSANFKGPNKWTDEEVADGHRGIRWITTKGVQGRPTSHDVMGYLQARGMAAYCDCVECKAFFATPSAGAGGSVGAEPAMTDDQIFEIADSEECNPDDRGWGPKFSTLKFARAILAAAAHPLQAQDAAPVEPLIWVRLDNVYDVTTCPTAPDGDMRMPLYAAQPLKAPPNADGDGWCEYIAGMIECYLKTDHSTEDREAAIAAIIHRRLPRLPTRDYLKGQAPTPAMLEAAFRVRATMFHDSEDEKNAAAYLAMDAAAPPAGVQGDAARDDFNGDDAALCRSIEALLALDAAKALVPHGVGGHARGLLSAAMVRLSGGAK